MKLRENFQNLQNPESQEYEKQKTQTTPEMKPKEQCMCSHQSEEVPQNQIPKLEKRRVKKQ